MCLTPIPVDNKLRFNNKLRNWDKSVHFPWKDYTSSIILVPCGHCADCIRHKQDSIVQRVLLESVKNHFFLLTLTYAPEVLPIYEINGYKIRYADTSDLQKSLKMIRKDNAFGIPFRYLAVSELGSLRGRPHFHVLLAFPKSYFPTNKDDYIVACDSFASKSQHYFTFLNYWRRNIGSRRNPEWLSLTRYVEKWFNGRLRKNYDFHYVNPFLTSNGIEDCGYYVLKYMFKPSDRAVHLKQALKLNLSYEEYKKVWNIVRPRYFSSIGFGYNANVQLSKGIYEKDNDILAKLEQDIRFSKENFDYPGFVHPFTGRRLLLSPYYMKNNDLYSYEDRLFFWNKSHVKDIDPIPGDINLKLESQLPTQTHFKNLTKRYETTKNHLDDLGIDADFDLLD